jgi:enoyl-CoA hydratase/carnithine racemase
MFAELLVAFDYADACDEVGVIIMTGAGRAFCAGADLVSSTAFAGTSDQANFTDLGDSGGAMARRIYRCLKPVIVAFNGPAVGVGLTMTLAADVRLAARDIKMGFVFAARGILPEGCSSWFLPRIVGISRALELCYSGRIFKSEEALSYGLVLSLHDSEDLLPAARRLANQFLETSAVSKAVLRQMFWRMLGENDPAAAHALDTKGMVELGASADAAEGTAAFLEKRAASFPGRVSKDLPSFMPWWTDGTSSSTNGKG